MSKKFTAKFCPACGVKFERRHFRGLHRECDCGRYVGNNPIPVQVVIVPVENEQTGETGIVTVRRKNAPSAGKLCLPGGFHNSGETEQEAAARELWEEANIRVKPKCLMRFGEPCMNTPRNRIITCWLAPKMEKMKLVPMVDNDEVSEVVIITSPRNLAFPSHTLWSREFFEKSAFDEISAAFQR